MLAKNIISPVKHLCSKKTNGSIMGLVVTISMLITLLSSMFILRSSLDSQTHLLYTKNDNLINNAKSGMEILLAEDNLIPENGSITIDLFNNGSDSVYLEQKTWGAFDIVVSRAFGNNRLFTKKAMIGALVIEKTNKTSLYVCDMGKPLALCGKTVLNGKCYVPPAGFKRAYIEGQNYIGDRYVYGAQLDAKNTLPEISKPFYDKILFQLKNPVGVNDSVIEANTQRLPDSIVQAHDKKTLVIRSNGKLILDNIYLAGNIKLVATEIILKKSCFTKEILCLAKSIKVEEGFTGSVQLLALEKIETGNKVELLYPSIVGIIAKRQSQIENELPAISIGEENKITGDIFCLNEKENPDETLVRIEKQTEITGNVYTQGKLSIQAKVNGSLYCKRFYLKTNSGIYENHILNLEVDASKLPDFYTGASIFPTETRKEVMVWL